jgi:hypothetical protein
VILEADHQADGRHDWRQVPDGGALLVGPQISVRTLSPR